jgi:hypothetical protein
MMGSQAASILRSASPNRRVVYPTSERFDLGTLTLGRYAHIEVLDRAKALVALGDEGVGGGKHLGLKESPKRVIRIPSIDTAPDDREAGTDGEPVSDDDEPSACSVFSSRHCPGTPSGALLGKATWQGDRQGDTAGRQS